MLAVIRIRGSVGVRRTIRSTLEMLNLTRVNHCVVVPDTPSYKGMLQTAKDYITWGEIDEATLTQMLEMRGRITSSVKLTPDKVREMNYGSHAELAKAILSGEVKIKDIMKPVFRLHPPRKGYGAIKKPYIIGGALGYRGKAINELIRRML